MASLTAHAGAPGGPGRTDPSAAAARPVDLRAIRRRPRSTAASWPPVGSSCCTTRTASRRGTACCAWSPSPRRSWSPRSAAIRCFPTVGWSWLIDALADRAAALPRGRRHRHPDHLHPIRRPARAAHDGRARAARVVDGRLGGSAPAPARFRRPALHRRRIASRGSDRPARPRDRGRRLTPRPPRASLDHRRRAAPRCCASRPTAYPTRSRPPPSLARAAAALRRRLRPGRRRRRARVGLSLQPAGLPGPAAPRRAPAPCSSTRYAIGFAALSRSPTSLDDTEWILHAANQDLPCLAELGLRPARLFDTELAGRLLGDERVALGTMVEQHLGVRLEKGHSAADWSTRPLPRDWLVYAALDVELLIALRDVLAGQLRAAGQGGVGSRRSSRRSGRAARRAARRPVASHVRHPRDPRPVAQLADRPSTVVRARRVTPPSATSRLVGCCRIRRSSRPLGADLSGAGRTWPSCRSSADRGSAARSPAGRQRLPRLWRYPRPTCPSRSAGADAMPPTSRWRERDPEAAARLAACRARHLDARRRRIGTPPRTCWPATSCAGSPGSRRIRPDATGVSITLATHGARPWQIGLTASRRRRALTKARAADRDRLTHLAGTLRAAVRHRILAWINSDQLSSIVTGE